MSKDKKETKDKTLNKFDNRKAFFNTLKSKESQTFKDSKKTSDKKRI